MVGNKKRGRNRERKKGSKIGKVTGGKRERGKPRARKRAKEE